MRKKIVLLLRRIYLSCVQPPRSWSNEEKGERRKEIMFILHWFWLYNSPQEIMGEANKKRKRKNMLNLIFLWWCNWVNTSTDLNCSYHKEIEHSISTMLNSSRDIYFSLKSWNLNWNLTSFKKDKNDLTCFY